MKKFFARSGLALAALMACAGAAQAQSTVQLYGLVDLSAGRYQDPGAKSMTKMQPGGMTTSYWGLRGKEELGGGLSAVFAAEGFFLADTGASGRFNGDAFFARNAYVGLSSASLGTVQLGRNTTLLFVSTIVYNAFGDSYTFSPTVRHVFLPSAITAPVTGDSGWSDSVLYTSPKLGGFKASVLAAAGEKVGHRNVSAGLNYDVGNFSAVAVYQDVEKDISTALKVDDTRTWQLGATYDFGVVKVFAQHTQVENRSVAGSPKSKLSDVSAAIPLGNGKVLAAYGLLNRPGSADQKTFSLGYDYFLSKRTDVYVAAMSDKDEAKATYTTAKSYGVGIRHRF
ncbi:porin [Azohydromonas lata]|uniref:porin n=1 Tax=Azohydromonas lata TaxID=45677 RepID=UPI00082DF43B|nr:porin [Azohydromonas lata]